MDDTDRLLTDRFEKALVYAHQLHASQLRKGSQVPYIAHLLGVTALVLEDGGSEDQAIAALLHDAVEDQGGMETLEAIRAKFGGDVSDIVAGCTDSLVTPKPAWKQRKIQYLVHLQEASLGVRRVALADKLHNARSILANLHTIGPLTWKRFNGGREGTLWYYRTLVEVFQQGESSYMSEELARVVGEIENYAEEES